MICKHSRVFPVKITYLKFVTLFAYLIYSFYYTMSVSFKKHKDFFFIGALFIVLVYLFTSNKRSSDAELVKNEFAKRDNSTAEVEYIKNDGRMIPILQQNNYMSRVVYNRVGKCGSRTMQNVIRKLAKKNNFNFFISPITSDFHPKLTDLASEVELISSIAPPMLYSRHIHYVAFEKFGAAQTKPIFINLIRDPVSRYVVFFK